jgi:hypothetical protein
MQDERRTFPRNILSLPIKCTCFLKDEERGTFSIESITLNVSDSGISFYSDTDLSGCSKVEIRGSSLLEQPRAGRIVWCNLLQDLGIFRVGVSFKHEDEELAPLEEEPLCLS